ncbi:MAG: hypothetical protein KDJ52_02400 [Anaerolineae bacterium]|nr:hypothetical protein [Anaerolineae bacterium]
MMTNNGQDVSNRTPLPVVRQTVRDLLLASPAYHELPPEQQREMASLMVRVCDTAARLVQEDMTSTAEVQALLVRDQATVPATAVRPKQEPRRAKLATAQSAGETYSGVAAGQIAGTTRAILNAVSFPSFVADLINGVFKAMTSSNMAQMQNYIELLNNVAASTEGFAALNYGPDRARQWLVEQFPSAYMLEGEEDSDDSGGDDSWGDGGWASDEPDSTSGQRVVLRPDSQRPSDEGLRAALGLPDDAPIPSGDPDTTLVPLVRQRLARTRQETLATLVRLGMQRIVIDGGRIHASMRFHIDTRSAAQADEGSTFDFRNTINAAGSFGWGPWGASASMQNTIGYVSTSQTRTTEEMNVDLDLNSSVELIFRTDQVPLNRLASADQATRILATSRNPQEEARIDSAERGAGRSTQRQADESRRSGLSQLTNPRPSSPPRPGEAGTVRAANEARRRAAEPEGRSDSGGRAGAEGTEGHGAGGSSGSAGRGGDTAAHREGGRADSPGVATPPRSESTPQAPPSG